MTFHSPHLLWLLAPLLLLFSWELARRASGGAVRLPKVVRAWAGAFQVSLGSRHTTAESRPRIWLWFGLAFCLVAAARPQWGVVEEQVFDQSREVLIAVDLSRSMLAPDVKPSRLDRARLLITALLDGLKGERVGLVPFAGTAFLQSPLSSDYEILREFLPALQPDFLPEGGSDYGAMIRTAIQAFGTSSADRYLIVLSDGESTEEGWQQAVPELKTKGIRVIGLGVGTTAGAFIPDPDGGFVKDERGAVVLSRLNASTLQELAQTTSGAYADASAWVDLAALLRRTVEAGRQGEFTEKSAARRIERFQWFLAPGLLLLFLSFWAEFPIRPRERALPLGAGAARAPRLAPRAAATLALLLALRPAPASAQAKPGAAEALAKPLTTTVARLAERPALAAKDCAELAQTTLTYGQRLKSGQQLPAEGVVRDALAAVDLGEKADPQAADWPRLRRELEDLLEKPAPPPPPPPQEQDEQQKQDPQQDSKDQPDQKDQQQKDQPQQDPPPSDQQNQEQQQKQEQQAFGAMQERPPPSEDASSPPPPEPQTQKVGGQKERPPEQAPAPELAVPLQKLDQVRDQDSPAKLQRLMQGQAQPKKKGKDW